MKFVGKPKDTLELISLLCVGNQPMDPFDLLPILRPLILSSVRGINFSDFASAHSRCAVSFSIRFEAV